MIGMRFKTSRAISPVIATVLLVAIVLAVSLSAFMWYKSLREEVTLKMEEKVAQEITKMYAGIKIVYAYNIGFKIKNVGTVELYDIKVYEDGTLKANYDSLAPGEEIEKFIALTVGKTLYVTAKYADDRQIIVQAPIQRLGVKIEENGVTATGNITLLSINVSNLPIESNQSVVE